MASPREIFEKDASNNLRFHTTHKISDVVTGESADIVAGISYDFIAGAKYGLIYVDDTPLAINAVAHYITHPEDLLKESEMVEIQYGHHETDESMRSQDLVFTRRLVAYSAFHFPSAAKKELFALAAQNKINLLLRDGFYIQKRIEHQHPVAFISHDSRDKDTLVSQLASTLQKMLCTVWYDEYSLVAGQSLRESIERGLKTCKKCILVLSPNFLQNGGWTKAEFDSVFTREILEKSNIVIPIWHGVEKRDIFEYSPRLLDKVGIPSSLPVEEIAKKVMRAIEYKA